MVISQQVLEEVARTFRRSLPEAVPALKDFLLSTPLEVVADRGSEDVSRWSEFLDEGDAGVIAAALAAEPDYFVTGDGRFLKNALVKKESGLEICTPSVVLTILGLEGTA